MPDTKVSELAPLFAANLLGDAYATVAVDTSRHLIGPRTLAGQVVQLPNGMPGIVVENQWGPADQHVMVPIQHPGTLIQDAYQGTQYFSPYRSDVIRRAEQTPPPRLDNSIREIQEEIDRNVLEGLREATVGHRGPVTVYSDELSNLSAYATFGTSSFMNPATTRDLNTWGGISNDLRPGNWGPGIRLIEGTRFTGRNCEGVFDKITVMHYGQLAVDCTLHKANRKVAVTLRDEELNEVGGSDLPPLDAALEVRARLIEKLSELADKLDGCFYQAPPQRAVELLEDE